MGTGGETALVATKLTPPTLPSQLVNRRRLVGALDAAVADPQVQMVLVSAPAGSGKSTLLAGWQQQRDDAAWVQADSADRDPARFWGHVAAALTAVIPAISDAVAPALPGSGSDAGPLIERIANVLASSPPATLVIDDYHLVANQAIDDALERLIELAPPSLMLMLSTRLDPSLRLSRLRVRSQLREIRAGELKFDPAEARLLLHDSTITDRHATALCERAEGWAAGLVLAGLSLRGSDNHDAFVEAFQGDDRLVVDYLTDEYLNVIPDEDRDRMLQIAILNQFCGPLIDAVCETTDGRAWLRHTAAQNQLIISLDNTDAWYRYHHLLADVLRLEAQRHLTDLTDAHLRAAQWHQHEGSAHEAVEHYLAAGDHQAAADLIYAEATELMNRGQLRTVSEQIDRLGAVADNHAGVLIVRGWISLLTGRFTDAQQCLDRARTLNPDEDEAGLIVALAIMVHAARGDAASALAEVAAAGPPAESTQAMTLGGALVLGGRFDEAYEMLDTAAAMAAQEGHVFVQAVGPLFAAIAKTVTGNPHKAVELCDTSIAFAEAHGMQDAPQMALGYTLRASGNSDADAATRAADARRGVELARRSPEAIMLIFALTSAGDVLCELGDPEGPELLAEARSVVQRSPDPGVAGVYLARIEGRHQTPLRPSATETGLVEELTDRELAVLRYLPSPMSQRDIAADLFVSLNTVKTHCRAIYRKLAVTDRKAAVQAARDAGLL